MYLSLLAKSNGAEVELVSKFDKLTPLLCTMMEEGNEAITSYLIDSANADILGRRFVVICVSEYSVSDIFSRRGKNGITPLVNAVALQRRVTVNILLDASRSHPNSKVEDTIHGRMISFADNRRYTESGAEETGWRTPLKGLEEALVRLARTLRILLEISNHCGATRLFCSRWSTDRKFGTRGGTYSS